MKTSEFVQMLIDEKASEHMLCIYIDDRRFDITWKEIDSAKIAAVLRYIRKALAPHDLFLPYCILQETSIREVKEFYEAATKNTHRSMREAMRLGFLFQMKKHFESMGD